MTLSGVPPRLAEAVDDERLVEPVADRRADLGAQRDANERAGRRQRLAHLGERRDVERASAVALGPPDAGSRLERDGQDPVLERSGGLAVVVGTMLSAARGAAGRQRASRGTRAGRTRSISSWQAS